MSDTFCHASDAFNDAELREWQFDEDNYPSRSRSVFVPDSLYYHTKIEYSKIIKETDSYYILEYNKLNVLVPKKICRCHNPDKLTIYVHKNIWNSCYSKSVQFHKKRISKGK